ncbi:hypothetical protein T12_9802 [Trichinella patagoniensis]|uniref:Uncharacterized protein n=1 Tax=Trichinella patagoniensis TaxID=990121 RepID=A0A0V0ZXS5_9BILA|nr:hypothetical protein T12_9802 [Trichinella patagoniensis]
MILPYTTKPSHVANKVVLNMIKRGSMPAGQRRIIDRVFKMEKKEWRQITTAQKLQIIQTDFLFGLQNIVKLKGTLLDCWGRPHPTLNTSKKLGHFIGKKCDKSFSCLAEKFNKIDVINLLISLYLEVLGLTSQYSQ